MRLLLDTDAFCKFAAPGLLDAAVQALGIDMHDLRRLPALPYMLRRGRLRLRLGGEIADRLLPIAEGIAPAETPSSDWMDRLVDIDEIDPGEAQLLALAAENDLLLLTGDKRALFAVRGVAGFTDALQGKLVLPEVALHRLCEVYGDMAIRDAIRAAGLTDVMIQVCFSDSNPTPRDSLRSYAADAVREFHPLRLWTPEAQHQGDPP